MQLAAGARVEPRTLTTIRGREIALPDPDVLTHLQFRRFAGCPICNIHLRSVAARHGEIVEAGIREVVVFHSHVKDMLPHQGDLPFDAIADPSKALYAEFGVETSPRAVLHPKAWSTPLNPRSYLVVAHGLRGGGRPTPPRGETILGLPADLLIEPDGRVRAAKYGRHASDQWSVDDLLRLA